MTFRPRLSLRRLGCALACAALLSNACAGKAEDRANGQPPAAGGSSSGGGSDNSQSSGQASIAGADVGMTEEGGATAIDEGGAPGISGGGATAAGGKSAAGGSAHAGASGSGGAPTVHCDKVICPSLPNTCKHIVQGMNDCCPTCTDSGCDTCPELNCEAGTHSETKPGDCCASCVVDPPDACVQGQKTYAQTRAMLLDKYSEPKCQNSAQCTIVNEDNACGFTCNLAFPTSTAQSFVNNLQATAKQSCTSCEAPAQVECDPAIAACVNGKCVRADVQ